MEDLFNFSIKRKDSVEFIKNTSPKNNEETKELEHFQKKFSPINSALITECQSPNLLRKFNKKSMKPEFAVQKIHFNLSINVKKNGSNKMIKSMMPSLHIDSKKDNNNSTEKTFKSLKTCQEEERARTPTSRISRSRHPSLIYGKRNKYISQFDGKSLLLSKIIRPSEENDNSLIYVENNFGTLNPELISSGFNKRKSLKGLTLDTKKGKDHFSKSNFAWKSEKKKSVMKEEEGNSYVLTIKKLPYKVVKEDDDEEKTSLKLSSSSSENTPKASANLDDFDNNFNVEVDEKERRIYEFLEIEKIDFIIVDQLGEYNRKLRYKKLIAQSKAKPMSPLMQRRQMKGVGKTPMLEELNLRSCLSTDNLERIIDINLDIK